MFIQFVSFSQTTNTTVKAKLIVEKSDLNIKITGTAENLSEIVQSLSYKLSVIKKNKDNDNQSTNFQEGFFSLDPSENKNLSTTEINLGKSDEVIVLLLFYNENKQIIGKDRIVLNDEKKKGTQVVLPVDGFEIVGIISDETKKQK
jgi:hypothetical protein